MLSSPRGSAPFGTSPPRARRAAACVGEHRGRPRPRPHSPPGWVLGTRTAAGCGARACAPGAWGAQARDRGRAGRAVAAEAGCAQGTPRASLRASRAARACPGAPRDGAQRGGAIGLPVRRRNAATRVQPHFGVTPLGGKTVVAQQRGRRPPQIMAARGSPSRWRGRWRVGLRIAREPFARQTPKPAKWRTPGPPQVRRFAAKV